MNDMLQVMWHSSQAGLCVLDQNGCFVTANPTLCTWLETPLEQLQQQYFLTFLDLNDDHKQVVADMYQDNLQADGETRPTVLTLRSARQSIATVWVQGDLFDTEQGERHYAIWLHKVDTFLGQEEIHYRSLIEHQSQFLVTRWRPQDLVFMFVNDAYAAFYGSGRADCVGQSILTFIIPEAQDMFLKKVARAVAHGETFTAEEYVRSDAGSWHWLRWINEPIVDSTGQIQFFQGMGVDVTEQVLRERALELNDTRYREISEISVESLFSFFYGPPQQLDSDRQEQPYYRQEADVIPDGTWTWERDWEPEPSTKRLTGYSLAEMDALGGWPALVYPDDLEHFNDSRDNLVPNERREAEYRLVTKAGKIIWIESRLHITAARDRPGLRVYGSDRDITDYKQVELALRQAVAEQDVMLKEIHHRVNNNMQVVSSLLALQSRAVADTQVQATLAESRARIMAMADVHKAIYESPSLAGIDVASYLQHVMNRVRLAHAVDLSLHVTSVLMGVEQAVPFGLIVNELLQVVFKRASQTNSQTASQTNSQTASKTASHTTLANQASVTVSLDALTEDEFAELQQAAGISSDLEAFIKLQTQQPQPERQIVCLTVSDRYGRVEDEDSKLTMTIVHALVEQLGGVLELTTSSQGLTIAISCPVNEPYTKTDTSPFWQTHAAEQNNF